MSSLARDLVEALRREGLKLMTCESMTGGLLAGELTSVPGASEVFLGGLITYSYELKEWLGVRLRLLSERGAVSPEVAEEMASACLRLGIELGVKDLLCLSVTGNAGPTALEGKPVGLYYIGWALSRRGERRSGWQEFWGHGTRDEVRRRAVSDALTLGLNLIRG